MPPFYYQAIEIEPKTNRKTLAKRVAPRVFYALLTRKKGIKNDN